MHPNPTTFDQGSGGGRNLNLWSLARTDAERATYQVGQSYRFEAEMVCFGAISDAFESDAPSLPLFGCLGSPTAHFVVPWTTYTIGSATRYLEELPWEDGTPASAAPLSLLGSAVAALASPRRRRAA